MALSNVFMMHSHMACIGGVLASCLVAPLDCHRAASENASAEPIKTVDSSEALVASEATGAAKGTSPEIRPAAPLASPTIRPAWEVAAERERERNQRERQTGARADWRMTMRIDTPNIIPCQPLCVTTAITNISGGVRKLDELLDQAQICIFAGRTGEKPQLVVQGFDTRYSDGEEHLVSAGGSRFIDGMLTVEWVDGSWSDEAKRIFREPGEYEVYAALTHSIYRFEVLRSEPVLLRVKEPTDAEVPYVQFFRDGNQIPPLYGYDEVDQEAYDKVRGQGLRTAAFRRKLDAENIDKLREILSKHPDPPVADDIRHYLMVKLIGSAKRYDEKGHSLGHDVNVLAAAAQAYLEIDPQRKQLRRHGVGTWDQLSTRFDLDHAQPILQVLASWKASSPYYEDEVESQAALDAIIAKIEARYARHARARAEAEARKAKLPTN